MFDTLTYANKLKEAGFTERQAQAQAEALVAVVDSNLATKQDIQSVKQEIELLRHDTKQDVELLRHDTKLEIELVRRDLKELDLKFEAQFILLNGKFDLVKWMLGFILAGILSLILKTFFTH